MPKLLLRKRVRREATGMVRERAVLGAPGDREGGLRGAVSRPLRGEAKASAGGGQARPPGG